MRELKFRAWDKIDKRLIIDKQDFVPLIVTNKGVFKLDPNSEHNRWIEIDKNRFDLMQYTGLKDKQGVDIYEGDILVAKNKKDSKNNDWIGIVEDNNFGWLGLKYKEYINPSWLGALSTPINEPQEASWIMSNCEVIGNIYENKELLL